MNYDLNAADLIAEAKYRIEMWLSGRERLELYNGDLLFASLAGEDISFTVEFGKLIFACWTEERAESWRVLSYRIDPAALRFRVATPFKDQVHDLVLCLPGEEARAGDLEAERRRYLDRLCSLVERNLSGVRVISRAVGRSDNFGFGAAPTRLVLRGRDGLIAGVGICSGEDSATVTRLLGQGLNWLFSLRSRFAPEPVERLMLFAPKGRAGLLAERLTLIRLPVAGSGVELFEVDEGRAEIDPVRPFDQGDLGLRLARNTRLPAVDRVEPGPAIRESLDWIRSLEPEMIEVCESSVRRDELRVEVNGLLLARVFCSRRPRIEFGIDSCRILTERNRVEFVDLVREVVRYRRQDCPDRQHPLYRLSGEAWLESILRRDIRALDPDLLPGFLYSQVPAIRQSGDRYIDLLGARSDGRLVVIELKVTEEAELPFQGLDYWLRVEWHRRRGDFQRRGYFQGLDLIDEPALVYLVSPLMRFHKNFATIASTIDSRVPVFRIAINDNWREGLKVFSRERVNDHRLKTAACGDRERY
jgi:hypothetical protein